MKIAYDRATDSLYVHLTDNASVNSDEVTDGVVLDFDANGALVGIDVQQASQRVTLVEEILHRLDAPDASVDALWAIEAENRLATYRQGRVQANPLSEVLAKYHLP